MASRHRSSLSWSQLNPGLSAALCGCLLFLFSTCSPTELPPEPPAEPTPSVEASPSVDVSPPFDVQAVIRRVSQAFRSESGVFTSGQGTYAVRVGPEGTVQFTPRHVRTAQEPPILGEPLKVKTASISRGGQALLQAARASVREDGALALARGPVVEVLQNGDEGLEQRWELASKPAGTGDLEVRVELVGLDYVRETALGHHYVDRKTGLGVRYGQATWVDAAGVKTPVESVREGRALVMRVPARVLERSAFPAVLDPIISPEISPDTPVPAPSNTTESSPTIAAGGGMYFVAWTVTNTSGDLDVLGTRVRASDGAVLDVNGIPLAVGSGHQSSAAVASSGSDFLVVWVDSSDIRAVRVRGSTGQLLGSPFYVSAAASSQGLPAVAFDGTHYLVVWDDYRGATEFDIYGARVRASDGAVLDPSGLPISTAARWQTAPAVHFDGSQFLVAWSDTRGGSEGDLYGTRVSVAGTPLDPEGLLISSAPGNQFSPSIASAGGLFFLAWDDRREAAQSDVYAARLRASDGVVLDPAGIPLATGPASQTGVSVASDGSRFLVVWHHSPDASSYDIHGQRVGLDGGLLDPVAVPLFATTTSQEQVPAVAFDGTRFMVVWVNLTVSSSRWDIHGGRVQASDLAVIDTPPLLCSGISNSEGSPAVAAGANSYLVVWMDSRDPAGGFDIYGVRIRASDGVVLDPVAIPISPVAYGASTPSVAFDGSHFLVVWDDFRGASPAPTHIYGARVREADGAVLDPEGIAISTSTASQTQSRAKVAFGEGVYLVTWTSNTVSGTSADVYATRVRASDGVVLDPAGIAVAAAAHSEAGAVTAFGGGTFLVAWGDGRNGSSNSDLYAARVRPADGMVLDSPGFPLTTMTGHQSAVALAFDGSLFLAIWKDERTTTAAIYGTRVRPSDGMVLDTGGGRVLYPDSSYKGAPALAFDGSSYLLMWRTSEFNGGIVLRLNGGRLAPDLTQLDASRFLIADMSGQVSSTTTPAAAAWGRGRFLAAYEPYDAVAAQLRVKVRLVSDPVNGSRCMSGTDCASGFCVDGVCCESACTGGTCGGGTCVLPATQLICPANVVAEATSASGALVSYPPATATGTAPLTVTYSQASGTRFAMGTTTVTAHLVDGEGRTASCSFSISVRDTTAPALSCSENLTAEATGPSGATVSFPAPTATDAVTETPTVTVSHASGSTFPLGATSVTATARDAAGNTSTCAFTLTVRDTTPPTVTCPENLRVDATSTTGANVTYEPATASDPVSSVTLSYSQASGSHFDVGTTPVSATATDGAGNSASCTFTVTVRLPSAPELTCPADVVAEATSASGALVSYPPATATGSEPLSVTYSQASGTQFALGATSVTATVTDSLDRTQSCSFSVTVRDTTAPSLSCPQDLVAEATGPHGAAVSYPPPTATDAVTSSPTISVSHASGSTFPLGSTRVTASATDAAGNASTCAFTLTVRDTSGPTLSCPAHVTAEATGAEGAIVTYPPAAVSDTTSSPTLQYSQVSGTRFRLGATNVTVTATDGVGNTSSCTFTVTVRDTTPPALACDADRVAEATTWSGASVDFALPTATDAVTASPVVTASHAPRSLFPLGATRVTVTASDAAGNASTCAFTVTVRDTTAPEVGCPGPLTAEALDATGAPVVFSVPAPRDTVTQSPTVTASHAPGSRFPLGTTQVVLSASDEAGNTASCTFSVTVRDTLVPQLTCPTHVQVTDAPPEGTVVNYPPATTSDAVSTPVLSYSPASGTVFPVGRTLVTVTATDAAGNSTTCSFEVRVAPAIQQPPEPPAEGCGCGAGSSTPAGLGWGALMLLAWGVARRRRPARS